MLHTSLYKTATGQSTFYFRTVRLKNSRDSALKLKQTLNDFESCLKKNLMLNFLETYSAQFLHNYPCYSFIHF